MLGQNIADTQFGFNVEVRLGAGAFVCGEETALIASIEGQPWHARALARPTRPSPACGADRR